MCQLGSEGLLALLLADCCISWEVPGPGVEWGLQ